MSKRWLGLLLFVGWIGSSGVVHAAQQINVKPASLALAFSNVEVGHASPTQRVTASNTGNAVLTINPVTFSAGGGNYTVSGITGKQTLIQGASVHWDIACNPRALGPANDTFQIASDAVNGTLVSVALTCSGDQGVLAADPLNIDFGTVLPNASQTKPLTLTNTGNVAVTGITAVFDQQTIGYSIDPTTPVPATLDPGDTAMLLVTFAPADVTDGGPATITVSGSWGSANTATAAVTLTGQTVSLNVTPTVLDFMNFRFDSAPARVFHIINDGTATVTIDTLDFTPDTGTASAEVALTIKNGTAAMTLPATLSPGQQFDVTVTAQPNNRIGLVSGHFVVHSTVAGMPDQTVTVTGNATAAVLMAPMVDFGAVDIDGPSPMQVAMIQNTGTAPLDISSITEMPGASSAFTFTLPAGAVQVTPGTTMAIPITYQPTVERGPGSFDSVVLVANLNGVLGPAQAMITVRGRGIDRHLVVADSAEFPPAILGSVGPTKAITVHNSGEATLSITALMITGDPVWQLVDASPVDIPGNASHDFLVKFAPPTMAITSFEGALTFINNDDGKPTATVQLTGDTVSIDVHGGGGCTTGREVGGGTVIVVLASLLVAARRRRAAGFLVVFAILPVRAFADDVHVGVFDPTPATTGTGFQLDSADVGHHGDWVASGVFSYATNPMVVDVSAGGASVIKDRPISQRMMVELGGAYAFLGRFEAGVRMPLYSQRGDLLSDPMTGLVIRPASGTALGDLTLHAKVRVLRMNQLTVGAALHVTLPTATKDQFTGVDLPTVRVLGLASFAPISRLSLSVNGGAVLRKAVDYLSIEQGSGLAWGAGASLRIVDNLFATGEVFGELVPIGKEMTGSLSPIEALLGASYRIEQRFTVGFAAGRGISNGLGAPDLRGTFTLSVASGRRQVPGEPGPARVRVVDSDGDGIPDEQDRCPNQPEDKNGIEDEDGCPELDSDHDGIPDSRDRCPNEPETVNGVEDADGCPDVGGDTSASIKAKPDPSSVKAAEVMFSRGRELMKQKKYVAACAAFEQSQHLDPAAGTEYNLAGCYAEIGKLATALTLYRDLARVDKNAERRAKSDELATQLAPRVPRLKLILKGAPAGVNVVMNGANVNALIGIEAPADLGTYTISADAPTYRGWRQTVEVKTAGEVTTIEIDLGGQSTP